MADGGSLDPEDARTTGAEFLIELPLGDVQLFWLEASWSVACHDAS